MLAFTAASNAHFLYLQIGEQPNTALASFSETGLDESLPLLNQRAKEISFWNGKVNGPQGAQTLLNVQNSKNPVAASWDYGVLDKASEGRGVFRLQYMAKAAEGVDQASKKTNQPLEITVGGHGGAYVATVLKSGKPVTGADLICLYEDEEGTKFKTDSKGQVWLPDSYSLPAAFRTMVVDKTAGKVDGKAFPETRTYATLVVGKRYPSAKAPDAKADPLAYHALRQAVEGRARIPKDAVVEANVTFETAGKSTSGWFKYSLADGVVFANQTQLDKGQQAAIQSLFLHRSSGSFDDGDGGNPLSFGRTGDLGTQVLLNDEMASNYWVKNGKIVQVNRSMGGPNKLVIDIVENRVLNDGTYLPKFFVAYTLDGQGLIKSASSFADRYDSVNGVWVPMERVIVTTVGQTTSSQKLTFSDFKVSRSK